MKDHEEDLLRFFLHGSSWFSLLVVIAVSSIGPVLNRCKNCELVVRIAAAATRKPGARLALCTARGLHFVQQAPVPLTYKGTGLDCGYRLDFLVERSLLVELKAVDRVLPIHSAQTMTYLKLLGVRQALLINFNVPRLTKGLRSFLL